MLTRCDGGEEEEEEEGPKPFIASASAKRGSAAAAAAVGVRTNDFGNDALLCRGDGDADDAAAEGPTHSDR